LRPIWHVVERTMTKIMHIGEAIRYVRTTLRLKIEMVAQEAGCAPSNLSRIENGRQRPSITLLEALARALQTPVSELYQLLEMHANTAQTINVSSALAQREWLQLRQDLTTLSSERRERLQALLAHLLSEQRKHNGALEAQAACPGSPGLAGRPRASRRVA